MGHVVNPVAFRLNFSKYWSNLHSEKKNSNYLNFSDYVLLISLKRLLKKRIFFRFRLVFDKLIFMHRYWQDLLIVKFKYSKYKMVKKSKKKIVRNKFKKKILSLKKKSWNASRCFYGMFARIKLRIALVTCFDFFKKPNFSNYLCYIKQPFSVKESSYHKLAFMFSSKFFRWYDKPLFVYKFSDYFFKFISLKKNLKIFFKKKKLVSNFIIKIFKNFNLVKSLEKKKLIKNFDFFFNKFNNINKTHNNNKRAHLVDFNFFKFHYVKPRFFNYPKKSFKFFHSLYSRYYRIIGSSLFRIDCPASRLRRRKKKIFRMPPVFNNKIYLSDNAEKEFKKQKKRNKKKLKKNYVRSKSIKNLAKKSRVAGKLFWFVKRYKKKNNKKKPTMPFFFGIQTKKKQKKITKKKIRAKILLPNFSKNLLMKLKSRKLIFFNIFTYSKKKKFNYKNLNLQRQYPSTMDSSKNNNSIDYVIFYKPLEEALDFVLAERKLSKKKRRKLLSHYVNMPIWDKFPKKYSKKRKSLLQKLGKLPLGLKRFRRRIRGPFFNKMFQKNKKQWKRRNKKNRQPSKKLYLSFRRKETRVIFPKKSKNINFLLLRLIKNQKIEKEDIRKPPYELPDYSSLPFNKKEDDDSGFSVEDFIDYQKKTIFKNFKRTSKNFFNVKRKLLFKIHNLLFIENLNKLLELPYNFNSLIKLRKNLKKYKKKYYSKKKFGILRYNSGFTDRVKIRLRRLMSSFCRVRRRGFLKYIKIKNTLNRFLKIGRKIKTKWNYSNYKKYIITKLLRKSSLFKNQRNLSYYKLRKHSRRQYRSTFWFFKNKTYLKKFFKFFKIKKFQLNNIKKHKILFTSNSDEKEQSAGWSFYSEFLRLRQYALFYDHYFAEKEREERWKEQLASEFKTISVKDRQQSLIREYQMVENFAEDPGLRMLLFEKYKKRDINAILSDIRKKIKNLERSKGKHNVYEKQKISRRKYRRRLWYNAHKTIKQSKNRAVVYRAKAQLSFLKDEKRREELERRQRRIFIFKSTKALFTEIKKLKFFYLKNYYINKMFILKGSYIKVGASIKYLNFLNLQNYFLKNYFFKKKFHRMLLDSFFSHLNKEVTLLDYFVDINFFNRKNNCNNIRNFSFFSKDIFISSSYNNKYMSSKLFYKNKFWINFIWNFYFSTKKSFYNRYFIKFFKKIYKLKIVLLNFINNFCFLNNAKIHFFIFKKKFIPTVTSFLNFFFYKIRGVKVKYHVKKTLKLLEKYFKYKIFSGYKFCLSGRYSRKDRAEFNWVREGLLPLTDKFSPVHYGFYFNSFRYGAVNVKFWILLKSLKRRNKKISRVSSLTGKI